MHSKKLAHKNKSLNLTNKKLACKIKMWKSRNLAFEGKSLIIKTFSLSHPSNSFQVYTCYSVVTCKVTLLNLFNRINYYWISPHATWQSCANSTLKPWNSASLLNMPIYEHQTQTQPLFTHTHNPLPLTQLHHTHHLPRMNSNFKITPDHS